MRPSLSDSVIVITGASSGIGRATAEAFAREGSTLVLAARREWALREAARECDVLGARTLVVPADVSDAGQVEQLARAAVEVFGRIDVWINNAAVSLFARFDEAPPEVYRRIFDVNLFGYIHGARAALPYFREQGSGVLINVSSMVAGVPQPYTSAYVATKCAIRGLSDCLRMELSLDEAPDIHVCTVLPASIDTPLFQQAANYTGRAVKPMDPVLPAGQVARTIVKLARRPKREVTVGAAGRLGMLQASLAPAMFERMGARMIDRNHLQDQPADPTPGNLFEPDPDPRHAGISGGWRSGEAPADPGPGGQRRSRPALAAVLAAAAAMGFWGLRRASQRRA